MEHQPNHSQNPPQPLQPPFTRLDDAHQLWHQAEAEYFAPEPFRVALNACIQALRTVTFVLQNNKHAIEGFEAWYGVWQARFRADPLLRWLVEARNTVEKAGDLQLHSVLRVAIIASYDDPPIDQYVRRPSMTTPDMLKEARQSGIPPELLAHGYLRLERRWITEALPQHELLDALAYCHSQFVLLLHDAWHVMADNAPPPPLPSGRLACMIRSDNDRSLWISLATGTAEPIATFAREVEEEVLARVSRRYGDLGNLPLPTEGTILRRLSLHFFARARVILQKDGHHDLTVFLLPPESTSFRVYQLLPSSQGDKYRMWREIATHVERNNAEGLIVIGEVWLARYDPSHPHMHAADYPTRQEALQLIALTKQGEHLCLVARFTRRRGRVALEQTSEDEFGDPNFLEPVRQVWRGPATEAADKPPGA